MEIPVCSTYHNTCSYSNASTAVRVGHDVAKADAQEGDRYQPHGVQQIGMFIVVEPGTKSDKTPRIRETKKIFLRSSRESWTTFDESNFVAKTFFILSTKPVASALSSRQNQGRNVYWLGKIRATVAIINNFECLFSLDISYQVVCLRLAWRFRTSLTQWFWFFGNKVEMMRK